MKAPNESLDAERRRGYAGGLIPNHRAFVTLPSSLKTIAGSVATGALFMLLWLGSLPFLGQFYLRLYSWIAPLIDLDATVSTVIFQVVGPVRLRLPYIDGVAGMPSPEQWIVIAVLTAIALVISLLLRPSLLPLAYALRVAAGLQAVSLAFFHFTTGPFPYALPEYTMNQLLACVAVMGMVPVVLAFTFYPLEFRWRQKAGLTLMVMAHIAVLVPLQCLIVTGLLRAGSMVLLPVLFIFFGLLPEVMVFVAFYGWGMSWGSGLKGST